MFDSNDKPRDLGQVVVERSEYRTWEVIVGLGKGKGQRVYEGNSQRTAYAVADYLLEVEASTTLRGNLRQWLDTLNLNAGKG